MFAYTTVGTNNWEAAKEFYDNLFAAIHVKSFFDVDGVRGYGTEESQPYFSIQKNLTDKVVSPSESTVIGLHCGTPNRVKRLYKKAMELGATSDDEPAARDGGMYYSANIRDLDGNKLALYARPEIKLEIPKIFRRGSLQFRDMASVRSGINIVNYMDQYKPIKNAKILDFGCGVKIAQALRQLDDPQKKYYGLDLYSEMIEFLQGELSDNKKYEFAKVPFHNDMYNKDGTPMLPDSKLPIKDVKADIICMFSVITHMNPEDTFAILSLLKRYASKETRLIFSCFSLPNQKEDFIDEDPKRPLLRALYNRDFLVDIIGRAGWDIVEEKPRIPRVLNDNFICKIK